MELEQKTKMLQMAYIGALVESLRWYTKEGILEKVTKLKKQEQLVSGKQRLEQLGISEPDQVFSRLSEFFGCASWQINKEAAGFVAETRGCLLCKTARLLKTGRPCSLYCLDPMEGMIKAINSNLQFKVTKTLWDKEKCVVEVSEMN